MVGFLALLQGGYIRCIVGKFDLTLPLSLVSVDTSPVDEKLLEGCFVTAPLNKREDA